MEDSQKPQFMQLLKDSLAAYGKALPEISIVNAWWSKLQPYPLQAVKMAFTAYEDENGAFAPVPAGIAQLCKQMDGRPGAEEAWAIALTSRDEADTVVWTTEIAEAFALCQPVLSLGDEVGARMAFKENYTRIVLNARGVHKPAQWVASLGWDVDRRSTALKKASVAGLLSASDVAEVYPQLEGPAKDDFKAHEQISKIKQMMADMNAERQRDVDLHYQRERDATANAKRDADEKVAKYRKDHGL